MGQNTLLIISLLLIALLEGSRSSGKLSYVYFAIYYLEHEGGSMFYAPRVTKHEHLEAGTRLYVLT